MRIRVPDQRNRCAIQPCSVVLNKPPAFGEWNASNVIRKTDTSSGSQQHAFTSIGSSVRCNSLSRGGDAVPEPCCFIDVNTSDNVSGDTEQLEYRETTDDVYLDDGKNYISQEPIFESSTIELQMDTEICLLTNEQGNCVEMAPPRNTDRQSPHLNAESIQEDDNDKRSASVDCRSMEQFLSGIGADLSGGEFDNMCLENPCEFSSEDYSDLDLNCFGLHQQSISENSYITCKQESKLLEDVVELSMEAEHNVPIAVTLERDNDTDTGK